MSKRKQSSRLSGARTEVQTRGSAITAEAPLAPDVTLVKVVAVFVAVVAVLETAWWFAIRAGLFVPICRATAAVTGAASNLTGVQATVTGTNVLLATRTLQIGAECTGASLIMIYTALVIAYPLSIKRKLIGMVLGVPAIIAANFMRLTAVAQLSRPLNDRTFYFVHDYLFQVAMVGVVIALWGAYLASARRNAS